MGYQTYFEGQLEIELKEPYFTQLKSYLSEWFNNKEVVVVNETSLTVNDEWNNGTGLMEDIILFIEKNGLLKTGKIKCDGEDQKDVWEIFISDNKSFIREIGSRTTYSRTFRKEDGSKISKIIYNQ